MKKTLFTVAIVVTAALAGCHKNKPANDTPGGGSTWARPPARAWLRLGSGDDGRLGRSGRLGDVIHPALALSTIC